MSTMECLIQSVCDNTFDALDDDDDRGVERQANSHSIGELNVLCTRLLISLIYIFYEYFPHPDAFISS